MSADRGPAVVALAGGVGAARFLRGLVRVVPAKDLTLVVNTGDDRTFYGVHVCPDLDIVTYTLAGAIDAKKGYGLAGDSFHIVDTLAAYGHEAWFRLGDRDLATCLHRTLRLQQGARLVDVTDEIRQQQGLDLRILPMSDAPCPTFVQLGDGTQVHFEEYLARDGAPDNVAAVDLTAAEAAEPAAGVLEAIANADVLLVCPSNPIVSIGPILALRGVREAIRASKAAVVGVSPIIGGAPVKGPADRLMRGLGLEVSARGVAGFYRDWIDGFVIDRQDAALAAEIEAMGIRTAVVDTLMKTDAISESLARTTLEVARTIAADA